jgi:polyribonucleotide nucleotidyltransferase
MIRRRSIAAVGSAGFPCRDSGSAFRAEGEIRRARIEASRASDRLPRPAFRAESEAALNLKSATGAVHQSKTPLICCSTERRPIRSP